jgi:hypothetical protein
VADVRLVTVFSGPLWAADLHQGLLEEEGIPTFLPDHVTKRVDPFITGFSPMFARIQVRAEDAERARALLEAAPAVGAAGGEDGAAGGEDENENDAEAGARTPGADEDLEALAARVRWWCLLSACLFVLPLPFALYQGWLYVRACRRQGARTPGYGNTLGGLVLITLGALVLVAVVVRTHDRWGPWLERKTRPPVGIPGPRLPPPPAHPG